MLHAGAQVDGDAGSTKPGGSHHGRVASGQEVTRSVRGGVWRRAAEGEKSDSTKHPGSCCIGLRIVPTYTHTHTYIWYLHRLHTVAHTLQLRACRP